MADPCGEPSSTSLPRPQNTAGAPNLGDDSARHEDHGTTLKAVADPVSSIVVRSSAASMVGTLHKAGRDSLFFQQRLDLLDAQLHSRLEAFVGHVMEQAGPQLADDGAGFQVPLQVDAANHQFASADAGLEDQSQTV